LIFEQSETLDSRFESCQVSSRTMVVTFIKGYDDNVYNWTLLRTRTALAH